MEVLTDIDQLIIELERDLAERGFDLSYDVDEELNALRRELAELEQEEDEEMQELDRELERERARLTDLQQELDDLTRYNNAARARRYICTCPFTLLMI